MSHVYNVIDQGALNRLLRSAEGAVAKDMLRRGIKVESRAKQLVSSNPSRVRTGRLRSSITHQLVMSGGVPVCRVGTNVVYARFVHDGTGLYGPRHRMIVPVNKKVLRWRGKGGWVYSRRSRGMVKNEFLKNALSAAVG